jgi:hypothetical protein
MEDGPATIRQDVAIQNRARAVGLFMVVRLDVRSRREVCRGIR